MEQARIPQHWVLLLDRTVSLAPMFHSQESLLVWLVLVGKAPQVQQPHNRTEAPLGLTSGLAPNDAGHLDTLHTSIAKVGYFTDIRWSN